MEAVGDVVIGFPTKAKDKTQWWRVSDLWKSSEKLPQVEVDIEKFTYLLDQKQEWFNGNAPTLRQLAEQAKRIYEADLAYPLILSAEGIVMDGKHRFAKAFMLGHKKITIVQYVDNPEPDHCDPL